jgi:hypothetical protein
MVRVACTHPVNPPGVVQGGGVLCSRVVLDQFTFWRIQVKVDICRFRFGSRFGPRLAYVVW